MLALVVTALPLLLPTPAVGQDRTLRLRGPDGDSRALRISAHRGYASLRISALRPLGWVASRGAESGEWRVAHGEDLELRLREGTPFFRWGEELLQFADEPYTFDNELHVPLQLVTDFFPARLPDAYSVEEGGSVLRVADSTHWGASGASGASRPSGRPETSARTEEGRAPQAGRPEADDREGAAGRSGARVVVIDPGHGGRDPGATGPGGVREKDVALAMALALEAELERYPGIEVHLTRETDELVPLWQRGEMATRLKGERPGVFVSLHANALPDQRSVRGFETYFLSEARTESERRVAANENAPLAIEGNGDHPGAGELSAILKELRNLDHQHWSAALAETVQRRVARVHPGPDRGVKQGPFAVITNAFMPAVLVETGFISNAREEQVLARRSFQEQLARAMAGALVDFFGRYPPGEGSDLREASGERT